MIIRRFTADDIVAIGAILKASPQAAQWDLSEFARPEGLRMAVWVAEERGEVVGVLAARTASVEAEILNLAVAPGWRRRGIARRLVETAIEAVQSDGAQVFFLEVRESNAAARAFYAGMGFSEAGRRRGYYRAPVEDALVLSRTVR